MKKLLLLMLITLPVEAKHLGVFGHTFEIIESDLLEVITHKLNKLKDEDTLKKHQDNIQAQMKERILRPPPVPGIIKTKTPRIFSYDPSIQVPYNLTDHQGAVFVKAGTVVNPLETHTLQQSLLFIDGDDETQVKWAIQKSNNKIILVKGAPFELINLYDKTFYFDQGGTLVKKFGIHQVPARISQDAKTLKIEEILLVDK